MAAAPIGRSLRRSEDQRLLTGGGRFLDDIGLPANGVACSTNALGTNGAGEVSAIGAPPAVVNAVLDALNPLGVVAIDMPMTPERVWRAIRAAAGA